MPTVKVIPVSKIAKEKNIKLTTPFVDNVKMYVIDGICYLPSEFVHVIDNEISFSVLAKDTWEHEGEVFTKTYK